ncbi:hypothetical protein SAMN05216223_110211 [Actinacidiphila yanglinensis]|uniref:Uncharacterized protein n=1 Tax=Actinacidiphila yanglinensis TaxID=310779 RepID=A0A1H6CX28_9ACTN|nr:hypothetical protein SAMN05216223_110211 [Actinacidiphila yanglinensis]
MTDASERAEFGEGGDPACWLDRVCEQCGAFRETAAPECARCGARFPGAGPSRVPGPPPLPKERTPAAADEAPPPSGPEPDGPQGGL